MSFYLSPFARGTILIVPDVKERRVLNVCFLNFDIFDKQLLIFRKISALFNLVNGGHLNS